MRTGHRDSPTIPAYYKKTVFMIKLPMLRAHCVMLHSCRFLKVWQCIGDGTIINRLTNFHISFKISAVVRSKVCYMFLCYFVVVGGNDILVLKAL